LFKKIAVTYLIASSAVFAQSPEPKSKNLYKTFKLSTSEMVFSCQNGANPMIKHLADSTIVVSCPDPTALKATWDGTHFICPPNAPYLWADESEALAGKEAYVYCGVQALLK
jgi:hypothetical protein